MEEEEASFIRITRRRFFFITVRADCIFLRPSAARTEGERTGGAEEGCPIRRIMWKEDHLITGVPGNRVLRPPPSFQHGFATPLRILDAILAQKGRRGKGIGEREDVPSIRGP